MRTSIKREVERDCFDNVSARFTTIYIKGNAKETMDQVWDLASALVDYIHENTNINACIQETGADNEVMVCTDAEEYEDYAELKEFYNDFKNGARAEVKPAIEDVDTIQEVEAEVINTIIELAEGYIALTQHDTDSYDYTQLSKTLKTELEHTLFSWACDILTDSEYTKEAIKDKDWIYYKQFSKLYHIIKGR